MTGIYVHVPFCLRKCPYCAFYSEVYDEDRANAYVDAVCRNISAYKGRDITADTLYFGGGTPSLLTPEQVGRIVRICREVFLLDNAEITLEANPCTADEEKLRGYRAAGVNRLSFGIQSADDERLAFLGRLHDFGSAVSAVIAAKNAGFDNISGDLMLGAKGETCDTVKQTIESLCSLPLTHVSAYMLKVEENTPFNDDKIKSLIADDDLMSELYLTAVKELEARGFMQYEISNFAKDGLVSRHNCKYWQGEEYLGFGASAHSFFDGVRCSCPPDIDAYIKAETQPVEITESEPDTSEEYILLGLRLCKGIELDRIRELYSGTAARSAEKLAALYSRHGLVRLENGNISLTPQGFLVSNSIIAEFISAVSGCNS